MPFNIRISIFSSVKWWTFHGAFLICQESNTKREDVTDLHHHLIQSFLLNGYDPNTTLRYPNQQTLGHVLITNHENMLSASHNVIQQVAVQALEGTVMPAPFVHRNLLDPNISRLIVSPIPPPCDTNHKPNALAGHA